MSAKSFSLVTGRPATRARRFTFGDRVRPATVARAEPQPQTEIDNPDSERARKLREIEELRAQEKFMTLSTGEADCISCGYHYDPKAGDPEYPISKGTLFQNLPEDWVCPVCGAAPKTFQVQEKEIAGFAVNQGYGLGTNSMTAAQKSLLIWGSLFVFFLLFLSGYFLQ